MRPAPFCGPRNFGRCLFEFIGISVEDTDGDLVHTTFKDDLLSFSCLAVTAHEEM